MHWSGRVLLHAFSPMDPLILVACSLYSLLFSIITGLLNKLSGNTRVHMHPIYDPISNYKSYRSVGYICCISFFNYSQSPSLFVVSFQKMKLEADAIATSKHINIALSYYICLCQICFGRVLKNVGYWMIVDYGWLLLQKKAKNQRQPTTNTLSATRTTMAFDDDDDNYDEDSVRGNKKKQVNVNQM